MSGLNAIQQRSIALFLDVSRGRGVQFQKTGPAMAGPAGPPATTPWFQVHSIMCAGVS